MSRPFHRKVVALLAALLLAWPGAFGQQGPGPRTTPAASQPAPDAKKARKAFQLGSEAEARGEWHAAFAQYVEATRFAPDNATYLMRREGARFHLVQFHMDRAERAAVAGHMDEARGEMGAALALDPTYTVAQERYQQFQPPPKQNLEGVADTEAGIVQLAPRPGTRSFNYTGDTRGAYEQVGKQFGFTVSFDPDLRAKQIRFRVADVDFATTMRVLSRQTDTFWRALDPHAFLVADDTPEKRKQIEPSVVRTVTLSGLATPEQMTEITRLVREIAGITRTQLDTRTGTLTLRGTPLAVSLARRLIDDLQQALGEVMLEVEILEVNRDAAQRLGLTPPSSARIFSVSPSDIREAQQSPEAFLQVIQRIFGTSAGTATAGSGLGALIPPLLAFGGGDTVFLATLPGATADFADSYSILRRGRRMLLRAQDGQPATFFIGERFPIALATLQPNLASGLISGINQGSFPRTDLQAADGPVAIAVADVNNDGHLDLVVANANADSISIFLGDGTGAFGTRTDVSLGITGAKPSAIVVGDFNGDSRPDIAVANEGDNINSVAILLQDNSGNFSVTSTIGVETAPRGMVAADLTVDGQIDLAVANSGSNSVSILRGIGDGTFQVLQTIPNVGTGPRAIAAGNLNAGTAPDLVVANEGSNDVAILINNGDGTFGAPTAIGVGNAPGGVTLADFNNDGNLDLAVSDEDSDAVSVLLGNGNGSFGGSVEFVVGDGPLGVAAGDFNLDGNQDIAVVNFNANTVTILLGTGDGGFGVRLDFDTGNGPTALSSLDLNGDGRRDLAITDREGDAVSVILNQATLAAPGAIFNPALQTAYPGVQYEDLGLKVRATPRLHPNSEVTLQLEIEIRSLTGQSINSIPVISNRTLDQTVRVREDQYTILAGILQREDRFGITGWPGIAALPLARQATSRRDRNATETDLVILIAPRRVRLATRVDWSLYVGRETTSGGGFPQ